MEKLELEHREWERTFTEERQQEEEEWLAWIRSNEAALRENRALPALLYQMARVYFGAAWDSGGFSGVSGPKAVEGALQGDQRLTQAVLQGFRGTVDRQDVPAFEEILSVQAQGSMHYLGWPYLAGLEEIERIASEEDAARWDDARIRKALAFYSFRPPANNPSAWYQRLLAARPEFVAEVQVQIAAFAFRRGREYVAKLCELARDTDHAEVAKHASLPLLRAFPVRCKLNQLQSLDYLLWAAVYHADRTSLRELVERKLSRTSMNNAQRVYWLAAGFTVAPAVYQAPLSDFVQGHEKRIRHLAEFFYQDHVPLSWFDALGIPGLACFIRLVGGYVEPGLMHREASCLLHSQLVASLIRQNLATSPAKDASDALASLLADPVLSRWHDTLSLAQNAQRIVRRDADYRHPAIEHICQTLKGGTPANPGDLAALVVDLLSELAVHIRQGNTDDWRQYWNLDSHGRPDNPRPENDCRDALLSDLRQRLPQGVDAQPEEQYANDKRADIRVSYGGFQVPVEIKKNAHPKLWSAMRSQLIAQYTSAPETDGYGIYLVFWFGEMDGHRTPPPPAGKRPVNAEELKKRLEATLSPEEARKISVCVIDVSDVTRRWGSE